MKRLICLLLVLLTLLCSFPAFAAEAEEEKILKILFTHDIHSFFDVSRTMVDGEKHEHGGAARLQTLLNMNRDENTIYLDAGDFSMGTLLQTGYTTDAYELRLLGQLGCDVTTFGNHEFDLGGYGAAKMLQAALASGDTLPRFVQSNMVLDGALTEEQQALSDAMTAYGAQEYTILDVNGLRVAVFGLLGLDSIECSPTSGMAFLNYIEAARNTVGKIREAGADVIICLSHSGTESDGVSGEDIQLARAVPEIDVIISGHSHTFYYSPVTVGDTIIASCGEYLDCLGSLTLTVRDGKAVCTDYRLIPCDESVAEDPAMAAVYAGYRQKIEETYLADEGCGYDELLCRSEFDFMSFDEMFATHQEYPLGNLIADSYRYEAARHGIDDIDVALVGLGTIRGTLYAGDITVKDAFEVCSLGMGSDGSAGHPIIGAYITGRELKLLVELDASLGPLVSYIKMSYSGLRYTFNTKRVLLDRAYDICLVRDDGTMEEIDDHRMYKVACNMYAANMLGMLNGLTHGILSITPKYADGTPVTDFYDCVLRTADGKEIKEWVAFKNYLASFPEKDGVPTVPASYETAQGRKEKVSIGGFAVLAHPGTTTLIVIIVPLVIVAVIVTLCCTHRRRRAKRQAKKAAKQAAKMQNA